MDLSSIRARIDDVDARIVRLFAERMDLAREVAESKRGTGKAVYDPAREREKLATVAAQAPEGLSTQAVALFSLLMSISRAEQENILAQDRADRLSERVRKSYVPLDTPFPAQATVACQGVEGAYSQIAACRLFSLPQITYRPSFEGVFRAVADGSCAFGVLPIENSTAGSVNAVYDLLASYGFAIVRSLRLKIDHDLLAPAGATLGDVREIFSHEQALAQCQRSIAKLNAKVTVCENTAMAAERVARSGRTDVAAISSRDCARLYGLNVLAEGFQDNDSNFTRFVVISAKRAVYPGATRSSLMITLPHNPGSLYRVLERFYTFGVNLVKLESRPIAGRDFEFAFYFDVDCPAVAPEFSQLLDALDDVCDSVTYLGSYTEIV